jgi:hypothetical protein
MEHGSTRYISWATGPLSKSGRAGVICKCGYTSSQEVVAYKAPREKTGILFSQLQCAVSAEERDIASKVMRSEVGIRPSPV